MRAFLAIGGSAIARHQLRLALTLECERIICLARALGPELIAIQHEAEREGAQFQVITDPRQLPGLVSARDDLLVLADGLLAAPAAARDLLTGPCVVLVQPVDAGVAAGFERLDLNQASAGAMRIPGKLVERLGELAPDCDVVSALTRIALQNGVGQKPVPAELRDGAGWNLIAHEAAAQALEGRWIELHIGKRDNASPGHLLAGLAVRRIGPALLHAGSGSEAVTIGSGLVLLFAFAASLFGHAAAGLLLVGLAWLGRTAASLLGQIERDSLHLPPTRFPRAFLYGVLIDITIVLLVARSVPGLPWHKGIESAFAPLMLVGLLRILPALGGGAWASWLGDRFLLALLLGLGAAAGYLASTVQLLAVLVLAAALFSPRSASRLT